MITAPYRFVPIARAVHAPAWGPFATHDVPLKGAVSGTLRLDVKALTPLSIGIETAAGISRQFRPHEGGPCAIPKSTIDGLLRSVLEVATFGRLGDFVDLRWPGMRDIGREPGVTVKTLYGDRMVSAVPTGIRGGRKTFQFTSRVKAGWLRKTREGAEIVPCDLGRIEIEDLRAHHNYKPGPDERHRLAQGGNTGPERQELLTRCNRWQDYDSKMHLEVDAASVDEHVHGDGNSYVERRHRIVTTGGRVGSVVMTGKPKVAWKNKHTKKLNDFYGTGRKKREFVFSNPARTELFNKQAYPVAPDVLDAFIHLNTEQGARNVHPSWAFWEGAHEAGEAVPVFYLGGRGQPEAMGMAQMFKLPFGLSTRDLLARSHPDHVIPPSADRAPDFPSTLMGEAAIIDDDSGRMGGRASRITFGMAMAPDDVQTMEKSLTLLAPNPGYYPTYVRQDEDRDAQRETMASYVDQPDANVEFVRQPELAGTKGYPARMNFAPENQGGGLDGYAPRDGGNRILTRFECVPSDTVFSGHLTFHNILPEELGAIVWALTAGDGDNAPVLRLGRGKAFGYGEVRITLDEPEYSVAPAGDLGLVDARNRFETYMQQIAQAIDPDVTWAQTPQILALLALRKRWQNEDLGSMNAGDHSDKRHSQNRLAPLSEGGTEFARQRIEAGADDADAAGFPDVPPVGTRVWAPGVEEPGVVEGLPSSRGKVPVRFASLSQPRSIKWNQLKPADAD